MFHISDIFFNSFLIQSSRRIEAFVFDNFAEFAWKARKDTEKIYSNY
jgi:hypothetical protein